MVSLLCSSRQLQPQLLNLYHISSINPLPPAFFCHPGNTIITLIPKTSPPSSAPNNYRPISLLPIVSKFLEKFMANILFGHLYLNSYIPPNQFGFMPMRSMTDALILACQEIHSSLDSSIPICGVFLDLKKAIDSVCHPKLIHKLNSLNLPSFTCHWLTSYLLGHTQSVRVGNNIFTPLPIRSDVPQRSILGPLLYSHLCQWHNFTQVCFTAQPIPLH